jgi:hypothetical protein
MKKSIYVKHTSHMLLALSIIGLTTSASARSISSQQMSLPLVGYTFAMFGSDNKKDKHSLSSFKKHGAGYVTSANARWSVMSGKDEAKK